jgi:hypothetical protein
MILRGVALLDGRREPVAMAVRRITPCGTPGARLPSNIPDPSYI